MQILINWAIERIVEMHNEENLELNRMNWLSDARKRRHHKRLKTKIYYFITFVMRAYDKVL